VATGAARLRAESAVVDGEVVAIDANGRPSFQALQHRTSQSGHMIAFYAFDVLHLDGEDLTHVPLEKRKAHLPRLLAGTGCCFRRRCRNRRAGHRGRVTAGPRRHHRQAEGLALSVGRAQRRMAEAKLDQQQEFVVGGYRPGISASMRCSSRVRRKNLRFAGKVRAGMNPPVRRALFDGLKSLHASTCPFVDLPTTRVGRWGAGVTADEMTELQWVKPQLVVQIRFVEWTAEGLLRHSAFLGVRSDKSARSVTRET
jgi:bifunctional non-homologous end joining protein LigD